ncbi:MAG TPA: hypothetical protein VF581_12730 [Flavobacterium sp.]|jgi:hypothetical protein
MARFKKIIYILIGILLFVVIANIGLNMWIAYKLPTIINRENESPYYITYDDLEVSLLNSNILAKDIVIVPKISLNNPAVKAGLYAKIPRIEVSRFKLWDLLFSQKIRARSIQITSPDVTIYREYLKAAEDKEFLKKDVVEPFQKIILISQITLSEGDLRMVDVKTEKTNLSVRNIAFDIDGILVTDDVLEQKIPFAYDKYYVRFDSLFFRANEFYHVRTKAFHANDTSLVVKDVKYIPQYSRANFVAAIPLEKDLFSITADSINIDKMKWGFKNDQFFFHCNSLTVNSAFANIYRGKMPPDDLSKKPLYNKLLRDLKIDLQIGKLAIRNSTLEYEEEKSFEKGAGMLVFSKFNMTAKNINSGFGKSKLPDVDINVNCLFMKSSPMNVRWTMNVLDKSDGFNIKGSILKFPAENLTPFTKPYMNVTAKGILDKVYFNFTGNDKVAKGDFAMEYDDLKVSIFRKNEPRKRNKILSAIANLFVKKDTKERIKNAQIEVERIPEKSFFNFFWRCHAEGLKKIMV